MQNNLPLNWCVKSFKDSFVSISPAYKVKQKEYNEFGSYPIIDQGEEFIGGYTDSNKGLISDVPIIAFGDHTRRFKYIDFAFIAGADGLKIYKPIYTDVKFSYYQCLSLDFPNKGYARHNALLQKCDFKIPPLAEQERIVAKIETLFADIDNGVERLKSTQAQIKQYRQSVLKSAFEGKLYKTTDWKEVPLKKVCDKIQDGSHFSPKIQFDELQKNSYPYITAKNIRMNHMDLSNLKYVTEDFHNSIYSRCNPEFGDVLLTKDGVNSGDVTLNEFKTPISLLSSVCLFKVSKKSLDNKYLKYFIQSSACRNILLGQLTGVAIRRIILEKIKELPIQLPTLPEQQHIVAEIEKRFMVADVLEKEVNEGLEKADKLKQSILKKAFEGKLAPQNPNDEPASVLLARIKKEQKPTKGKKK